MTSAIKAAQMLPVDQFGGEGGMPVVLDDAEASRRESV